MEDETLMNKTAPAGKEILRVVEAVSNEKRVSKEIIFQAIEAALASATKKRHRLDLEVRVAVDRSSGHYETFRRWEVVADEDEPALEFPDRQIRLADARQQKPDVQIDEYLESPIDSVEFGRIGAQNARHVIVQKVREAERARVVEVYQHRVLQMVTGIVKSTDRNGAVIDLGDNVEGFLPRSEMIPRENVRSGDRMRCYLREVRPAPRGPQLVLSRTATELLIELFKLEVPEINEGLIEIVKGARDPGFRARIAVRATETRTDPIGACVGMRGSRVQAVSNELAGERVDIVQWDENPAQYAINAMVPADIISVVADEDVRSMDLIVEEENLSQAIGRGGQNVKLASDLIGWELNVISVEEAETKHEDKARTLQEIFQRHLAVDEELSNILVQEGFSSIEEIAYVPENEFQNIEEFKNDESLVAQLRKRAKDWLLTRELAKEIKLMDVKPAENLLSMEGMDQDLAYQLASCGVVTMEDLADQSIDELLEIEDIDKERAGALIMTARAPQLEKMGREERGDV